MPTLLLIGCTAFCITFFALPAIIRIAAAKKLFDLPDTRKIHKKPIASLGGVGMFAGFFLTNLLFISTGQYPELQYLLAAAIVIFFLGLKDDILVITPLKKFLGQVCAAAIIIHLGGLRIDSMHGVFGVTQLPEAVSLALSYTTVILVINAYNLIDGIDGLAASLGLLAMAFFGFYFYSAGEACYAMLSFSLAGSLVAFLIFNHPPAKIFMGDSGSLLLGLFSAVLALKFIVVADTPGAAHRIESAVPLAISVLGVPLADTLRVFSIRIFNGRSPFSPDRNHIHHILLRRGLSHKMVTISCVLANMLLISLAFFGRLLGATITLGTVGMVVLSLLGALIYFPKLAAKPARPFTPAIGALPGARIMSLVTKPAAAVNN